MQAEAIIPEEQLHTEPLTIEGLGVDPAIVRDLCLKTMFYQGRFTRAGLAGALKVSVPVVDELTQWLARDGLVTVLPSDDSRGTSHGYVLTQLGYQRAEEALSRSSYVGAVPVSLSSYVRQVSEQSAKQVDLDYGSLDASLDGLVLPELTRRRIGWAVTSHRPLLIHGASGNGKTTLARSIAAAMGGSITIPYAVEVVGQIVRVFDESKHVIAGGAELEPADDEAALFRARGDRRWVEVERPVVWAGGELTRSSLELIYDGETHTYESPLQLKANGGVLIIDDLGRQQLPAIQLLNRWIVALEAGVDHLTLHTGQMVEVPFDTLLIFSTNMPPTDLADEAFLRRIRYKVRIENPTIDEYREIFHRECALHGMSADEGVVNHLLATWYRDRDLRGCHPRDLLDAVVDASRRAAAAPQTLTADLLDEACATYFL